MIPMTIPAEYVISHKLLAHRPTLRLRPISFHGWRERDTAKSLKHRHGGPPSPHNTLFQLQPLTPRFHVHMDGNLV